ncbi:hypothetical protein [Azohydromonas aeria]|uniref:hypothetical protein n=1 Tax=Azohydromonas aeria TaxID=2590212 RepID=UPI0012F7F4BF|nr:hypothetical protein [Azohydromonas aeria]
MSANASQVHDLALILVNKISPEEVPLFEEIYSEISKSPSRHTSNPLGSGVGEGWALAQFITPVAMSVAGWFINEVLFKSAADVINDKLKEAMKKLITSKEKTASERKCNLHFTEEQIRHLKNKAEEVACAHGADKDAARKIAEALESIFISQEI